MQQIVGLTPWMMTLGVALVVILEAVSVIIATVTMLTMEFLVGVRKDVTIDGADPNRLDWLVKYLRPSVLHLLEL